MGDKKSSKTQEKKQQVDKVVDLIEQWLVLFDIDPQQIVDVMIERQRQDKLNKSTLISKPLYKKSLEVEHMSEDREFMPPKTNDEWFEKHYEEN